MASTLQAQCSQSIPLQTLTAPSNSQSSTCATGSQIAPHNQAAIQHATTTSQGQPAAMQLITTTHTSQASSTLPSNVPIPCQHMKISGSASNRITHFLLKTSVGNAVGIVGLVLALGLGLFSAITTYRDMKWSEQAGAVQACTSLYVRCICREH